MNAITEISDSLALNIPEALNAITVFAPGGVASILDSIERSVRAVDTDISTPRGRKEIASLAHKVARSKTALDEMGKGLNEQKRSEINAVDAERRIIRERLDALRDEVRQPLTDWERAEEARIKGHEEALAAICELDDYGATETSDELCARLSYLRAYPARDWQEFSKRASVMLSMEIGRTELLHAEAQARELAEVKRLRAAEEAAEAARQQAIRDQQEREARIAAEAAEAARIEAEERAAATAKAEADRVEAIRLEIERRQATEAAKAKAERDRLDRERLAAKAEIARLEAEAIEADLARIAAENAAEANRIEAEKREAARRKADAEQAERDRVAAIEAERQRVANEQRAIAAEAERRAADKRHRQKINNDALVALTAAGIPEHYGISVITAIARGQVPNVQIVY